MAVYEITGLASGVSNEGVNFLEPADSYSEIIDGFIYRQVLQSRRGVSLFAPRLEDESRVMGIFEHILPDGSKELLVADKNFLYKYNTGTGVFDKISFGGTMSAYTGFKLPSNEDYISGTSYPDKDNNGRFVFTSRGMTANVAGSGIFFYNGTDVRDYTDTTDNPEFTQPPSNTLVRATHVFWFNERLNLVVPQFAATTESQGVLYSGIRAGTGNGDKFNAVGSGIAILDTYQTIKGASILGDVLALNLTRSNWVLEKTTDPFNPYRARKIPSVLGTDASFSMTQWHDKIRSAGITGMIGMDTSQSQRVDNKIPYFTRDEMDPTEFELTYGGFDRDNAQFLFSYLESGVDTLTQNKVLVNNYEEESWSVFNMRISVFGQSDVGREIVWNQIDDTVKPSWGRWDTTEEIWNKIGLTASRQKTLAGDDEGFIYELNQDHDDYFVEISNITNAAEAVLTVDESAFKPGDLVVVQNVEGMTEINNYDPEEDDDEFVPYTVVSATNTSVTLNANSSNFSSYTSGGSLSKVISFSAKTNQINPFREQGKKCFISMIEFLINTNGGKLFVDIYADGETTPFKSNILIKPTDTRKSRNWVEMSVCHEADFFTIGVRLQSPSVGVELTSMRLHIEEGGSTSV